MTSRNLDRKRALGAARACEYGDLKRDRAVGPNVKPLSHGPAWDDLGDLKRELLDIWTDERNALAKTVMQDMKKHRGGTSATAR